jgi:hypothetical protein
MTLLFDETGVSTCIPEVTRGANPPAVDRDLAGQGMTGTPQWPPLIICCCANNPKVQPVAAGHSMALARWQLLLDELLGRIAG